MQPEFNVASPASLLSTIEAFREGNRRFNLTPDFQTDEEADAAIAETYGPPLMVLRGWDRPAETMEEATEALQILADDEDLLDWLGAPMVKAALGFLHRIKQPG